MELNQFNSWLFRSGTCLHRLVTTAQWKFGHSMHMTKPISSSHVQRWPHVSTSPRKINTWQRGTEMARWRSGARVRRRGRSRMNCRWHSMARLHRSYAPALVTTSMHALRTIRYTSLTYGGQVAQSISSKTISSAVRAAAPAYLSQLIVNTQLSRQL